METRQEELKATPERQVYERRKSRFQIVKLEERIAPFFCHVHLNAHGKEVGSDKGCGFV